MKKRIFITVCCCLLFTLLLSGCRAEHSEMNREGDSEKECKLSFFGNHLFPVEIRNAEHEAFSYVWDEDSKEMVVHGEMPYEDLFFPTGYHLYANTRFSKSFAFTLPIKTDISVGVDYFRRAPDYTRDFDSRQSVQNCCGTVVFHENNAVELYGDTTDVTVMIQTEETRWTVTGSGGLYAKAAVVNGEIEVEGLTSYTVKEEGSYLNSNPASFWEKSSLVFNLTGEVTITNDAGETLTWDSAAGFGGNMEVYATSIAYNGEGSPIGAGIEVPFSDHFAFENPLDNHERWFALSSPFSSVQIAGIGFQKAELKSSGAIELEGDFLQFDAAYRLGEAGSVVLLRGTGSRRVSIQRKNQELEALGTNNVYTVEHRNESGEVTDTSLKDPMPIQPKELGNQEHSILSFGVQGNFTITNDFGETLTWESSSGLGGNMEVYRASLVRDQENFETTIQLEVPVSDRFTLKNDSPFCLSCSLSNPNGYVQIYTGSGFKTLVLDSTGTIDLNGDSLQFNAVYRPADEQDVSFHLNATGGERVIIHRSEDGLEAFGTKDAYTVEHRNESDEVVNTVSKERKPIPAELREHSVLSIDLAGTFTITNDFGETLIWDSSSDLVGSMKVYNTSIEPTGGDGPAPMHLEVPASDHFTLEPNFENDLWFAVSDLNGYVRIAGSGIKTVYLSSAGTMKLTGDSMEFNAAYRPKDEQGKSAATSFNLHGAGEKEVYIRPSEDGLEAFGTTGAYTVERVSNYGEVIDTASKTPKLLP